MVNHILFAMFYCNRKVIEVCCFMLGTLLHKGCDCLISKLKLHKETKQKELATLEKPILDKEISVVCSYNVVMLLKHCGAVNTENLSDSMLNSFAKCLSATKSRIPLHVYGKHGYWYEEKKTHSVLKMRFGYVYFGRYMQGMLGLVRTPIAWHLLAEDDDVYLLMSKDVLIEKPYNKNQTESSWDESTLKEWMETSFFNTAFSSAERNCIGMIEVPSVSLFLSLNEKQKRASSSLYSKAHRLYCSAEDWWSFSNGKRYWLTDTKDERDIQKSANAFRFSKEQAKNRHVGVRPVIILEKSRVTIRQ